MNRTIYIILTIISLSNMSYAQPMTEKWDTYIASYESEKPGTVMLRMDLINHSPIKDFSTVLVTGLGYEIKREDGFPLEEQLNTIYTFEDQIVELIASKTESLHVGTFTYNGERLQYFYLQSINGIKEKLEDFYNSNGLIEKAYINIKEDVNWEYYNDFLYPNEPTRRYMSDQKVVFGLMEAGDDLTKKRPVDHWIYFEESQNMKNCKQELIKLGFEVKENNIDRTFNTPFAIQIQRVDFVDIDNIYPLTSELTEIARNHNGSYDGWETFVIKE